MIELFIVAPKTCDAFPKLWSSFLQQWQVQQQQQQQQVQQQQNKDDINNNDNNKNGMEWNRCIPSMYVHAIHSRIFWRELWPCLLEGRVQDASRMAQCLLLQLLPLLSKNKKVDGDVDLDLDVDDEDWEVWKKIVLDEENKNQLLVTRKLQLQLPSLPNYCLSGTGGVKRRIICWVYSTGAPAAEQFTTSASASFSRLEYTWEERLIHWEHQLMLAQSLAGYFSTLGGGYFMTHHVKTAFLLAIQQQRMAAFLGNHEMVLKCQINMAYDLISCGMFSWAKILIHQVQIANNSYSNDHNNNSSAKTHTGFKYDVVIDNMCKSALVHSRRVRKWAQRQQQEQQQQHEQRLERQHVENSTTTCKSSCRDDYYRIRIIQDRSSEKDIQRTLQLA